MNEELAREKLKELLAQYDDARATGKEAQYSEADVSSKLIMPLLGVLGWNVRSIDEVKEQRRTISGPVDFTLSIDRKPRLLLELKRLTENLDDHREAYGRRETYPEQATRYAWHLKVEWAVLTNFRELRLYNAYYKRPLDGLRLRLYHSDFLTKFDSLWLLSRESVQAGELDRLEKKAERKDIDEAVLEDLLEIRRILTENIGSNSPDLTPADVRDSVQKIMDRLLVIRVAEDRGIIGFESLRRELDSWKNRRLPTPFMRGLKSIFRAFDETYNTKLFAPHSCEDLPIRDDILERVLDILYRYNFDLIGADVLGAIYEDYIGHILEETATGGVQIAESRDARKRGGIYYTPTHLVEYVVSDTLGELLSRCKTPEDVSRIKVLDPACGSGSFLIKAFDLIKEWYDNYNRAVTAQGRGLDLRFDVVTGVEKKILTENLFGVDIDPQAAEIASVNLMLKGLKIGEKLPQILDQNVRIGNSLVDGGEEGFGALSEEVKLGLCPFVYHQAFPEIFLNGGFDVVIGNPPYYKVRKTNPIRIAGAFEAVRTGPVNAAMMFIHRSIELAKPSGYVGLVLPKMVTYTKGWNGSRRAVFETKIRGLVDCQEAFEGVLLEQVLMTTEKVAVNDTHTYSVGEAKGEQIVMSKMRIRQSLAEQEHTIFLEPNEVAYRIRSKMLSGSVKLGPITKIVLGEGIQSYPCWRKSSRSGDRRILRGDDVQMWHVRGCLYFSPRAREMERFEENIKELSVSHIVAQRIVAHVRYPKPHIILMAAHDPEGSFAFNTVVHLLVTDGSYDASYILGLLNSKLLAFYAYKFIYSNAIRSMDFYEDYAARLPIKEPSKSSQEIARLVEEITAHYAKPARIRPDYPRYLTERAAGYKEFNEHYRQLDPGDRDPKDIQSLGRITRLALEEQDDWLSFKVDHIDPVTRKLVAGHEVLRCRFRDRAIRAFLLNEINGKIPTARRGTIFDKLLSIRLRSFHKVYSTDCELIRRQLEPYLRDADAHRAWEAQYAKLDEELNRIVYEIYGLEDAEIRHVEENSRPTGWHVDARYD